MAPKISALVAAISILHTSWVGSATVDSVNTSTADGWQLQSGYYQEALQEAEQRYPRPDAETPDWSAHRKCYPGLQHRHPVKVGFGSWPFYFQADDIPEGATMGSQLEVDAYGRLIPGNEFGVFNWDNPIEGTYTITVSVHFQDGSPSIPMTWTLTVSADGTIFVDASAETSGDGTEENPFKTLDDWYLADRTDRTYHGYQVYYRNGTYDVYSASTDNSNNIALNHYNKPMVHLAYPGDSEVYFNYDNGNFVVGFNDEGTAEPHGADFFMRGIKEIGGKQTTNGGHYFFNARCTATFPYADTDGTDCSGCRNTWFECAFTDWELGVSADNNVAIAWAPDDAGDGSTARSLWVVDRCSIDNIRQTGSAENFNGFWIGNVSQFTAEFNTVTNTNFGRGPFSGKSGEIWSCYRWNYVDQDWCYDTLGSYSMPDTSDYTTGYGGGTCFAFNRVNGMVQIGHHVSEFTESNPYHIRCYHYRNTVKNGTDAVFCAYYLWETEVYDDVWVSDYNSGTIRGALYYPGNGNTAGPINDQTGETATYAVADDPTGDDLFFTDQTHADFGLKGVDIPATALEVSA